MSYPESLITCVDILIDGPRGCKAKWLDVKDCLLENGVTHYEEGVKSDELMVSSYNRGGLGVNAHDVHRQLLTIMNGGADPEKLLDATSHELAQSGPERERELEFNRKLIANSKGMLAPLTHKERLCTLGCGHFNQGVRGTKAGVKTPQPQLADTNGCLSLSQLGSRDHRYKKLCTDGYRQLIIPAKAIATWPKLPSLIQRALNASNPVATQTNELEVMVSIAEYVENMDVPN